MVAERRSWLVMLCARSRKLAAAVGQVTRAAWNAAVANWKGEREREKRARERASNGKDKREEECNGG